MNAWCIILHFQNTVDIDPTSNKRKSVQKHLIPERCYIGLYYIDRIINSVEKKDLSHRYKAHSTTYGLRTEAKQCEVVKNGKQTNLPRNDDSVT